MAIICVCPSCGKKLSFKKPEVGGRVRCPGCNHVYRLTPNVHVTPPNPVSDQPQSAPQMDDKTITQRPLSKFWAKWVNLLGWILVILGGFICIETKHHNIFGDLFHQPFVFLITVVCGIVLAYIGNYLVQLGKQSMAESASELLDHDKRPPVLYLRSFQQDGEATKETTKGNWYLPSRGVEEDLADALRAVGPVVAIGKPGETLPEVGAARMYVDNEHWQETVLRLMDSAKLVVLWPGETQGFCWEMKQVLERVSPGHLLLYFPNDAVNTDAKKQYAAWHKKISELTMCSFPEDIGRSRFIWIDPSGNVLVLKHKSSLFQEYRFNGSQAPVLQAELRPLLASLGVPDTKPSPFRGMQIVWVVLALLSLIVLGCLVFFLILRLS